MPRDPNRQIDPLSRPYDLPSGGVYYPEFGHPRAIHMAPIRGAQEEVLAAAAASENPQQQLAALRHVTEQCFSCGALPFPKLLLDDWMAALLNFLSYSTGSDILGLRPVCPSCKKANPQTRALGELPYRVLRFAENGEPATWPPGAAEEEEDPTIAVLREMEQEETGVGEQVLVLRPQDAEEPFTTGPLPMSGHQLTWRMLRLEDLARAEEFSSRIESTELTPGSALTTFLYAMHIVGINGERVGRLQAVQWWRAGHRTDLNEFRSIVSERSCGYDTSPRFRCKHCGTSFKARLPLAGGLFRRAPSRAARRAEGAFGAGGALG